MTDPRTRINATVNRSLGFDGRTLDDETTFEELGADSIDRVELVMAIEDDLGIVITDDEWARVQTFGQAVTLAERKLAGVGA